MIKTDDYGAPLHTDAGVRCGNHGGARVRHESAEAVRYCYDFARAELAQMEAERAAELAYERHLEDRGWWAAEAERAWCYAQGIRY